MLSPRQIQALNAGLQTLGLPAGPNVIDAFSAYHELIAKSNRHMNLVSKGDLPRIVERHFLDSLTIFRFADLRSGAAVLDLGSGAGFPGIPIKIVRPDLTVDLLESHKKKCWFLERAVRELRLEGISVICERAEEIGRDSRYAGKYDYVLARAFGKREIATKTARPFLKADGAIAFYAKSGVSLDGMVEIIQIPLS